MGYRLYRHVLDHAPADLTSGERLLLLVIADDANDNTRSGWPGTDVLVHRTGMGERGIRKAFERLAERGLEVRLPIAHAEDGRPVFAVRGRRTTYRIPVFTPRADAPKAELPYRHSAEEGGTTVPPNDEKGGTTVPERRNHSSGKAEPQFPPSPQSPHSPHHTPAHEGHQPADASRPPSRTTKKTTEKNPLGIVMDATGATETEAQLLIDRLQAENDIRSLSKFLTHVADNGDLDAQLVKLRNSRRRRATVELCDEHTRPADRCPFCAAERTAS
jgi:hypothetical protein